MSSRKTEASSSQTKKFASLSKESQEDTYRPESYKICLDPAIEKENIFPYVPVHYEKLVPIEEKHVFTTAL